MQLNKHQIIKDIYDAMGMVESLGCSEELTALSVKLGVIAEDAEKLVDEIIADKARKESRMYYVLALADYEDYQPHWFDCDCTKEKFKQAVTEVMGEVGLHLVKKHHGYIDGYDMLKLAVRLLSRRGFKRIETDYEIKMYGACLYRDDYDGPNIIPEDALKAITKHNDDVDNAY